MEIEPSEKHKNNWFRRFANVTFESFDELWDFGHAAPILSKERNRALSHYSYGMWPGPSFPETFPFTAEVPETVLARAAGQLMLWGKKPHEEHMLEQIGDYFKDKHEQPEVSDLSDGGL